MKHIDIHAIYPQILNVQNIPLQCTPYKDAKGLALVNSTRLATSLTIFPTMADPTRRVRLSLTRLAPISGSMCLLFSHPPPTGQRRQSCHSACRLRPPRRSVDIAAAYRHLIGLSPSPYPKFVSAAREYNTMVQP